MCYDCEGVVLLLRVWCVTIVWVWMCATVARVEAL